RDPALHGWHERRGTVPALAADLRHGMTSTLYLEPWPLVEGRASLLGQGCGVEVQFWESGPTDELVAPRPNPYLERLSTATRATAVTTLVDGVEVPTLSVMVPPTVTECRFPIDVVITWVDGTDPEWDASRQARLSALAESTSDARRPEASGRARFVDHGELRYALRSLDLFAPWVRRIHLVTAGQKPDWLDADHPRVTLVDHRDILPPEALPTFNSHAIETALHRVEGLAEHFIYLNDDVMLARPLRPEDFFSSSGIAAVSLSPVTVGLGDDPSAPPFLKAAWNNRELLSREFGAVLCRTTQHTPHPLRVSVLEAIEARFPAALAATARAPFRSETDVSLTSSLAQHYGLLTGTAVPSRADLAYVDISNADLERRLRGLLDRDQDYLCIADHHDHALRAERLEEVLHAFFGDYFPVAAPWELSAP
ncbi:MAG: stealth family protein, partial [Nocardioides sp.]